MSTGSAAPRAPAPTGVAISLVSDDERGLLKDIQKTTRQTIPAFDRRNDRSLGALAAVEKQTMPERAPGKPAQGRGHGGGQSNGQGGGGRNRRRTRPGQGGGSGGGGHHAKPQNAGPRPIAATQPAARWSPVD